jgi:hypothetical protein
VNVGQRPFLARKVEYTPNTLQTLTPEILQIEIRVMPRFLVVILRGRAKSSIVSELA